MEETEYFRECHRVWAELCEQQGWNTESQRDILWDFITCGDPYKFPEYIRQVAKEENEENQINRENVIDEIKLNLNNMDAETLAKIASDVIGREVRFVEERDGEEYYETEN